MTQKNVACPLNTCPYVVARYGTVRAFSTNKLSCACCRVGISPSPSSSESSISLTCNNHPNLPLFEGGMILKALACAHRILLL